MEISIRPATNDDTQAIAQILDHAVKAKMFRGDLAWGDTAYTETALQQAITRGSLYVAELAGESVVATFQLEAEDRPHWGTQPPVALYIQRFATANGFRGQKLGAQILDLIGQVTRSKGLHFIRLVCSSKNPKLCAYHEAHGFIRADHKANPMTSLVSMAFYERLVDPAYREPVDDDKRGLLQRLRRRA